MREILHDTFSNTWKYFSKDDELIVFCLVSYLSPLRMVTILLASFGITTSCQYMSTISWTDPDIRPGGRNTNLLNTLKLVRVTYWFSIHPDIAKMFPNTLTSYTRCSISNIA